MHAAPIARPGEARRFRYRRFYRIDQGRWVNDKRLAATLARHPHPRAAFVGGIITLNAGQAMTTVVIAIEHAAFVVDGDLVKIEQVAVSGFSAAAPLPGAGVVLNGIVGGGIGRDPGATFVVGRGDEDIP